MLLLVYLETGLFVPPEVPVSSLASGGFTSVAFEGRQGGEFAQLAIEALEDMQPVDGQIECLLFVAAQRVRLPPVRLVDRQLTVLLLRPLVVVVGVVVPPAPLVVIMVLRMEMAVRVLIAEQVSLEIAARSQVASVGGLGGNLSQMRGRRQRATGAARAPLARRREDGHG